MLQNEQTVEKRWNLPAKRFHKENHMLQKMVAAAGLGVAKTPMIPSARTQAEARKCKKDMDKY